MANQTVKSGTKTFTRQYAKVNPKEVVTNTRVPRNIKKVQDTEIVNSTTTRRGRKAPVEVEQPRQIRKPRNQNITVVPEQIRQTRNPRNSNQNVEIVPKQTRTRSKRQEQFMEEEEYVMSGSKRVLVSLKAYEHERLNNIADTQNRSTANLISTIIKDYLSTH